MRALLLLAALLATSGCAKLLGFDEFSATGGGDDEPGDDAAVTVDTAPVGPRLRISGLVRGSTDIDQPAAPLPGIVVQYFDRAGTMRDEVATDASGQYILDLAQVNGEVDGFLHLTDSAWRDSYVHFPAPLTTDVTVTAGMFTTGTISQLASQGSVIHQPARAAILFRVRTAAGAPVAGATVTIDSDCGAGACGDVIYTNAQGRPDVSLTSTSSSGLAYAFSVVEGGYEPFATVAGVPFGGRYYGIGDGTMVFIDLVKN